MSFPHRRSIFPSPISTAHIWPRFKRHRVGNLASHQFYQFQFRPIYANRLKNKSALRCIAIFRVCFCRALENLQRGAQTMHKLQVQIWALFWSWRAIDYFVGETIFYDGASGNSINTFHAYCSLPGTRIIVISIQCWLYCLWIFYVCAQLSSGWELTTKAFNCFATMLWYFN